MPLSDIIQQITGSLPRKGSIIDRMQAEAGVLRSAELQRIAALPGRFLDLATVLDLTPLFAIEDHGCRGCDLCRLGPARLRPIQSAGLLEAEAANGLFAAIGVGNGKELLSLLLPDALHSRRAVIITKPRLRDQLLNVDVPRYGRHFRLPMDRITVIAYSDLSNVRTGDVLDRIEDEYGPIDLIVANEAHRLRNITTAACAKRFRDWVRDRPGVRFCALTGTPGPRIRHYAHLAEWALRSRSPLPASYREIERWGRALDDETENPMHPGALVTLMGEEAEQEERARLTQEEIIALAFGQQKAPEVERGIARRIYQRRLAATRGVVISGNAEDADCSLVLNARYPKIPPNVQAALDGLRRTWKLDDEEFCDAKDVALKARQLSCGFYYYWDWPGGVKDQEWIDARSVWFKVVAKAIRHYRGFYSPLMVWQAVERGELEWAQAAFKTWAAVRDRWRPEPPRGVRWLSDFIVDDAVKWSKEIDAPGIIWYEFEVLEGKLRERGVEVYGGGKEGDRITSSTAHVVGASSVHSDGKNLQHHFSNNLILASPANSNDWQQRLGRTHRPGQSAEEVSADVNQHDQSLRGAFQTALTQARVVEDTQGEKQKILYATRIGFKDE